MSFEQLIAKVHQAEAALEARERSTAADWRQLKNTWRAAWTPGRIVIAGVVSGFVVGRLEPGKRMPSGNGVLQMITALAGMFAGTSAQAAAGKAKDAAQSAEQATGQPTAHAPPVDA